MDVRESWTRRWASCTARWRLWVGGGVASQDEGRLDEVHLTVVPVVLGDGKGLFERPLPSGSMQLTGTRAFNNGMVELRYRVG